MFDFISNVCFNKHMFIKCITLFVCSLFFFVHASDSVVFKIAVISTAQCYNGIDDDNDWSIDAADTGCTDRTDNQESSSSTNNNSSGSLGSAGSVGSPSIPVITLPPLNAAPLDPNVTPEDGEASDNEWKILYDKTFVRICEQKPRKTFYDFKEDILCEGFISRQKQESYYNYGKNITKKEVTAIALKMRRIPNISVKNYTYDYDDVGIPGQISWILPMVETSRATGLLGGSEKIFQPDRIVTRAESFSLLMKSVCFPQKNLPENTWQYNIFQAAKEKNITTKSWENFWPDQPVLRQEIFVIASRLADWADETGGCGNPQYVIKTVLNDTVIPSNVPKEIPVVNTQTQASNYVPINLDVDTSLQLPGTFALLAETENEKIMTYIVRSGWSPEGVRLQYVNIFWLSKSKAKKITIRDINGLEYSEKTWFLANQVVYVYLPR